MRVFCIGRNYSRHAAELNNAIPENPVVFLKPPSALLESPGIFELPDFSSDVHYECELVVEIGKKGKNIPEELASDYISRHTLGIDFTARDVQKNLKDKKLPWELSKAFDSSAPVGRFKNGVPDADLSFFLLKNDIMVQEIRISKMIFSLNQLISFLSRYFTLQSGDLVYTGTPEGVGPVTRGDVLKGYLNDEDVLEVHVH